MKPRPNLRAVTPEPEPPIDVTALLRRDIEARDWAKCHVEGDRRQALDLPERVRRIWRA
jgi:hypothetical protein